jgi:hypothetical protein
MHYSVDFYFTAKASVFYDAEFVNSIFLFDKRTPNRLRHRQKIVGFKKQADLFTARSFLYRAGTT